MIHIFFKIWILFPRFHNRYSQFLDSGSYNTLLTTFHFKEYREKREKVRSCLLLLPGQGTAGQMVPVVLVQPGWLMVVAATEVGWAIPTLAYGWQVARGGLLWLARGGRWLMAGLAWHGRLTGCHGGSWAISSGKPSPS